mmetsp:Transcript_25360/g.34885  ORF Transcript_25360/g.34885 Transcript_25360/m.34885 type:complete len:146 (-) Transcript_25360:13-450(-)
MKSAPWVKDVWFFGTSYVIPNVDSVVLGGTAQKGDFDLRVRASDTARILQNVSQVLPALKTAPLQGAWVGLRPGRAPLRLDSEIVEATNGKEQRLLAHCYGHGGSGITLSMGCAGQVVRDHILPFLKRRKAFPLAAKTAKVMSKL